MAPFNSKLEKDQPKPLGDLAAEELRAKHDLQEKLVSPSIFALPNARTAYKLGIDACSVQLGCVLLQEQLGGTTKPVRCRS